MTSALLIILLLSASVRADLLRVPISKKQTAVSRMAEMTVVESPLLRSKYSRPTDVHTYAGIIHVNLTNFLELVYYGNITVGTPPQNFSVMFDTASEDLYLPSSKSDNPNFEGRNKYNSSASSTYRANGQSYRYRFADRNVTGFLSVDTVRVNGVAIANQTFAEIVNVSNSHGIYDGIFGLNLKNLSHANQVVPHIYNMWTQGLLERPLFSVYLRNESEQSAIIFGGTDRELYSGDLLSVPVLKASSWKFRMDSAEYDGQNLCGANCIAIPDTGTAFIVVPADVHDKIRKKLNLRYQKYGLDIVDCSDVYNAPTMRFVFGGGQLELTAQEYIMTLHGTDGERRCVSSFMKVYPIDIFVLGDVFLRKFYTVFDFGSSRLSFGLAK